MSSKDEVLVEFVRVTIPGSRRDVIDPEEIDRAAKMAALELSIREAWDEEARGFILDEHPDPKAFAAWLDSMGLS